ncbi:MAG TPA: hypothetical protein PLT98_06150, partial [Thauera aminoaromatica]|nr:hypothetical protein [Thauera aminoaromatica]
MIQFIEILIRRSRHALSTFPASGASTHRSVEPLVIVLKNPAGTRHPNSPPRSTRRKNLSTGNPHDAQGSSPTRTPTMNPLVRIQPRSADLGDGM